MTERSVALHKLGYANRHVELGRKFSHSFLFRLPSTIGEQNEGNVLLLEKLERLDRAGDWV